MDELEIPEYFVCPISLQIMKDPVTAATGITYDRESIERWLSKGHNTICPVTKQLLPKDSELTPNHTLRRLIQAWSAANAPNGTDQISSPKPPLSKFFIICLIRDLWLPNSRLKALKDFEALAVDNERNRKQIVEAGVVKAVLSVVVSCHRKRETAGLEESLSILYLIGNQWIQSKLALVENDEIIEALIWVLGADNLQNNLTMKSNAASALKIVIQLANSGTLERLKPEFFHRIVSFLREGSSQQGTNSALNILLDSSPWGRNRIMMVDAETVFHLIELELKSPEKKTTELIFAVLFHLCSCADGRAQFLNHAAGIAVVARRILKVSPSADDRAILILSLICKFSATAGVLHEMLRVGAVAKLCMVLQANCASYLKDKAQEILRSHNSSWKNSPCVEIAALTTNKVC